MSGSPSVTSERSRCASVTKKLKQILFATCVLFLRNRKSASVSVTSNLVSHSRPFRITTNTSISLHSSAEADATVLHTNTACKNGIHRNVCTARFAISIFLSMIGVDSCRLAKRDSLPGKQKKPCSWPSCPCSLISYSWVYSTSFDGESSDRVHSHVYISSLVRGVSNISNHARVSMIDLIVSVSFI